MHIVFSTQTKWVSRLWISWRNNTTSLENWSSFIDFCKMAHENIRDNIAKIPGHNISNTFIKIYFILTKCIIILT